MKTHDFDPVSFIAGLIFAAVGALYLIPGDLGGIVDVLLGAGAWFWPVVFIALGLAVLSTAIRPSRSDDADTEETG